jgi:hypothetical protein
MLVYQFMRRGCPWRDVQDFVGKRIAGNIIMPAAPIMPSARDEFDVIAIERIVGCRR